jgi:toxin FitB
MYLLDTNVVSELRRGHRANAGVAAWSKGVSPDDLFISAITILEIERGILLVERRDARQGDMLRGWLESKALPAFANRILPVDTAVARRCAQLHVPDPRGECDALIAATALVHGLTLVTCNIDDFRPMEVTLLNPWE